MKTQERTKAAAGEPPTYAPPDIPLSTLAELAKAESAALAGAGGDEGPDAELYRKKRERGFAFVYAAVAAVMLAVGDNFEAMFWTAFAFYSALEGETRRRVPKLVRYSAFALLAALSIFKLVMLILKSRGH